MYRRTHPTRPTWFLLLLFLGLAVALSAAPAGAQSTDLDRKAREIGSELRCPVCQNLSVADSPSPLAGEMRAIIRQKLEAGESRQAILQYFVASYGEVILLDPPQQGFTMLVWLGAVAAVVGGAALLFLRLRRALGSGVDFYAHARSSNRDGDQIATMENDPYEAALDTELDQYQQGVR